MNDYLHQILDAIPHIVFVKSPEAKLMWGNKALLDYYGMTAEQLKGITDAPFVAPDVTQGYIRDDLWVANNGKVLDVPEEVITKHTGEVRLFHTIKTPLFDTDGKVTGIVGISIDITEQKKLENEKTKMQAQTVHSSKLAAIGLLASGVAHEINNPLTIISLQLDMLKGRCKNLCEANCPAISAKIEKANKRISKIVDSLRTFARPDAVEPETVDLVRSTQLCLDLIGNMFTKDGVEIETDFSRCSNPKFLGNEGGIQQVLMNLLTNARDAIKEVRATGKIRIVLEDGESNLTLSVIDNGAGIKPEHLSTLFEPFFTTKPVGKGTGLGLPISLSIIKSMGGSLTVKSKEGEGTTFTISLPKEKHIYE